MNKPALVCDTSPLLYLGRLGQAQLLPLLFQPVYMPEQVIMELATGRLLMPDTIDPTKLPWITPVAVTDAEIASLPLHRLGLGECAVLGFAHAHAACWVGLDDRQARLLAQSLGLGLSACSESCSGRSVRDSFQTFAYCWIQRAIKVFG